MLASHGALVTRLAGPSSRLPGSLIEVHGVGMPVLLRQAARPKRRVGPASAAPPALRGRIRRTAALGGPANPDCLVHLPAPPSATGYRYAPVLSGTRTANSGRWYRPRRFRVGSRTGTGGFACGTARALRTPAGGLQQSVQIGLLSGSSALVAHVVGRTHQNKRSVPGRVVQPGKLVGRPSNSLH